MMASFLFFFWLALMEGSGVGIRRRREVDMVYSARVSKACSMVLRRSGKRGGTFAGLLLVR